MKKSANLLIRAIALLGLVGILGLVFSDGKTSTSAFDLRAATLVFLAPVCVLVLFRKESLEWGKLLRRGIQLWNQSDSELYQELEKITPAVRGQYGFSQMIKFGENHSDSTVHYATELFSARFTPEQLEKMLSQRIQSEDEQWSILAKNFGFLAKMAPYFGMLATVIGMVHLLDNMTDFSQISKNMALAMQGTLFGLISFTLVYSPFQKFLMDLREQVYRRNVLIAQWYILVAAQADPNTIQHELRSCLFKSPSLERADLNPAQPARGST